MKRLKEIFQEYAHKNGAIEDNFQSFEKTLGTQISKFKAQFPSANLTIPIMAVPAPALPPRLEATTMKLDQKLVDAAIAFTTTRLHPSILEPIR